MDKKIAKERGNAEKKYHGAAIDKAEGEKATIKNVKDYVETLNDNPRNNK